MLEKEELTYNAMEFLLEFPEAFRRDPHLPFSRRAVRGTPFILLYSFDDNEVQIHFVIHISANPNNVNPAEVTW